MKKRSMFMKYRSWKYCGLLMRVVLAVFVALAAGAVPAISAGGGKPAPNPKMRLTIMPGFDVVGDGAVYVDDSAQKVEAQIWAGGSEDFTLRLYDSSRKFTVNYTSIDCGPSPCGTNAYNDGWWINIRQIGTMAPGETRWTRAHLMVAPSRNTSTTFSWCGGLDFVPEGGVSLADITQECAGSDYLVSVYRDPSLRRWTVSTADPIHGPDGKHVSPFSDLTIKTNRSSLTTGPYRTTFQLQIDCVSYCDQLPQ